MAGTGFDRFHSSFAVRPGELGKSGGSALAPNLLPVPEGPEYLPRKFLRDLGDGFLHCFGLGITGRVARNFTAPPKADVVMSRMDGLVKHEPCVRPAVHQQNVNSPDLPSEGALSIPTMASLKCCRASDLPTATRLLHLLLGVVDVNGAENEAVIGVNFERPGALGLAHACPPFGPNCCDTLLEAHLRRDCLAHVN